MTTPAKSAKDGKKTGSAARTAPTAFDFSTIQVADGNVPQRAGGKAAGPNPFVAHLEASMAEKTSRPNGAWVGKGKTLTVPKAVAKDVVNLLRYAANRIHIGVTISDVEDAKLQRPGGQVQIDFAAKSRKQKKAVAKPAAPAA